MNENELIALMKDPATPNDLVMAMLDENRVKVWTIHGGCEDDYDWNWIIGTFRSKELAEAFILRLLLASAGTELDRRCSYKKTYWLEETFIF